MEKLNTTEQRLQDSVKNIANCINNSDWANGETGEDALNCDGQPMTALDYLQEALDFQWVISSGKKTLLGARILVSFGGPNIWINTHMGYVEGYWASDTARWSFTPNDELNEALETIYGC